MSGLVHDSSTYCNRVVTAVLVMEPTATLAIGGSCGFRLVDEEGTFDLVYTNNTGAVVDATTLKTRVNELMAQMPGSWHSQVSVPGTGFWIYAKARWIDEQGPISFTSWGTNVWRVLQYPTYSLGENTPYINARGGEIADLRNSLLATQLDLGDALLRIQDYFGQVNDLRGLVEDLRGQLEFHRSVNAISFGALALPGHSGASRSGVVTQPEGSEYSWQGGGDG